MTALKQNGDTCDANYLTQDNIVLHKIAMKYTKPRQTNNITI